MFTNLITNFENLVPQFKALGYQLEIEENNDSISFRISKIDNAELKKEISEFKKFVDNIEDNFFEDICKKFNEESNITLGKFDKLMDEAKDEYMVKDSIALFKELTKEVVQDYIDELNKKYNL